MAATYMTASASSGYMTNVSWGYIGNQRAMFAHYSAPNEGSYYITPGMNSFTYYNIQDADVTKYVESTNSVGSLDLYFSGLITGSTGYIFIMGN
jgi:hypothetical protein